MKEHSTGIQGKVVKAESKVPNEVIGQAVMYRRLQAFFTA